jgi:Tfp pilus assembly protein PilF
MHNMELAEQLITKALQIAPAHNMARYHLANLYYYR